MTARPPSVTQCICSLGCWGASWWPPCSGSDTRSCCKHPRAGFRAAMNVQLLQRMPKTATARTYFIVMFCSREEATSFLNPQTATHVGDENVLSKAILPETVATCFPRRLGRRVFWGQRFSRGQQQTRRWLRKDVFSADQLSAIG